MNRSAVNRAAWALLFSFACNGDSAHEMPPTPPGAAADLSASSPPPRPPEPDDDSAGRVCRVDADCGAGHFCELRICIAGCTGDDDCEPGASCDPHGRCSPAANEKPSQPLAAPVLVERFTVLGYGETEARTVLRNEGSEVLTYRLEAASPALTLDRALAELAPGDAVDLVARVDLDLLGATDCRMPVQIVTSGGAILWSIEVEAEPEFGHYRGAVNFDMDGVSLARSDLALDLDFRDDGTIAGRVDTNASLLWPQPVVVGGTWTPAGDITIALHDRLPADGWRYSPIARELGRTVVLAGSRTAAGLQGTITESITGLREAPVQVTGSFTLRRQGPLTGLVHAADDIPGDAAAPTWLAPPGLDLDACEYLGMSYGTDGTLTQPTDACDACADGSCTAADMLKCGSAIRLSAYNLADVLDPLHGGGAVQPPTNGWTWDDCTATVPTYDDSGAACLDIEALRCAHALIRRGTVQTPGETGELYSLYAAFYAADEALAAALLSTETQIDAAFAYKNELGEPVSDVLARELQLLAADRERLAAALAPTLAPAYAAESPDLLDERVILAPLTLVSHFAAATAQWARLAHRSGANLADVRAAVRLAAIATHAAGAELHARLHEDPDAAIGLHALGPALETLAAVHAELTPEAAFGYPAAYVPLALGPPTRPIRVARQRRGNGLGGAAGPGPIPDRQLAVLLLRPQLRRRGRSRTR